MMSKLEAAERFRTEADLAEEFGDLPLAIERMNEALKLQPSSARYWVILGNLYRTLKNLEESEFAIRKGIEFNPSASFAWTELGLLYRDRKDYQKASEYLLKSSQLRPDVNTFTVLAAVCLAFDAKTSLRYANKALRIEPNFDEAISMRDAALRKLSKIE